MPTHTLSDGESIYYELHEEGAPQGAPVVVLLNGMTQSTMHWRSHARALEARARVLLYDARGQGQSGLGDAPLTLPGHADELVSLLDALQIERAHLVGFSHGARVALAVAAHHPTRVDKLILCSATAQPTALARTILRAWRETLRTGGLEAMSWAALPTILGDAFLQQSEAMIDGIIKASVRRNSVEGVSRLLEAMIQYPSLDDLAKQVRAPTLVLSASEDLLVSQAGAAALAALCDATHEIIEGSGHTIPIEAPDAFRAHLTRFLEIAL